MIQPINRLMQEGLILLPVPPHPFQLMIQSLSQGRIPDELEYCTIKPDKKHSNFNQLHAASQRPRLGVYFLPHQEQWLLVLTEGHGGLVDSDFLCSFPTFDALADAVLAFYFGEPTVINGWVVPLHRHPELEPSRVRKAIEAAQTITSLQYQLIRNNLEAKFSEETNASRWNEVLQVTFLRFSHITDSHRICYLRRNMEQAYIVDDRPC